MILAVIVVAGLWFGLKAIREAPVVGEEGGEAPPAPMGMPPASVIVAPVESQVAAEEQRVTGSLRARSRAEVAAQESGAVEEVKVDEGDQVKKGDVVAKLDGRRLSAELAQAKARVTAAKATVTQREAESKRAAEDLKMKKELVESRAVSQKEFLDSEREAAVAAAMMQAANDELAAMESALELFEVRLDDLEVRAPFDGRVVARHVEPGEWVSAGTAVMTLVTSGEIEAWLNVPERFASSIEAAGSDLAIVADGTGARADAKSVRRVADVDPRTRLFTVVATIDDSAGTFVPGMSVHADLPVGGATDRLAVPVDAIMVTRDETFVFRAGAPAPEGGMPTSEKIPVTELFRRNGIAYLDSASLQAGDRVVVEGNERLFPGTPLMIAEPQKVVAE